MTSDTKTLVDSLTSSPNPIDKDSPSPIRISSIENICRRFKGKYKKEARALIRKYKGGEALSKKEIIVIAKAIYFSTFCAALNLKYSDKDEKGNTGCIDPFEDMLNEVRSFGLEESREVECDYNFPRLAHPAYWFGERKVFKMQAYRHKDPSKYSPEHPFLWQPRNISSTNRIEMEYARGFNEYREYFAANLENVLASNSRPK